MSVGRGAAAEGDVEAALFGSLEEIQNVLVIGNLQGTEPISHGHRLGEAKLLRKEARLVLLRQAIIHAAEDREVVGAVDSAQSSPGVHAVEHVELAVAEGHLDGVRNQRRIILLDLLDPHGAELALDSGVDLELCIVQPHILFILGCPGNGEGTGNQGALGCYLGQSGDRRSGGLVGLVVLGGLIHIGILLKNIVETGLVGRLIASAGLADGDGLADGARLTVVVVVVVGTVVALIHFLFLLIFG